MPTFANDKYVFCFLYSTGVNVLSLTRLLSDQAHSYYPKHIQQLTGIFC